MVCFALLRFGLLSVCVRVSLSLFFSFDIDKCWVCCGVAGTDGSISLWSSKTKFARPTQTLASAHTPNTDTSGLTFSKDSNTLVSRGTDNTLKVWDLRNFKAPVHAFDDLENFYSQTNAVFSPVHSDLLITGTSNKAEEKAPGSKGRSVCAHTHSSGRTGRVHNQTGLVASGMCKLCNLRDQPFVEIHHCRSQPARVTRCGARAHFLRSLRRAVCARACSALRCARSSVAAVCWGEGMSAVLRCTSRLG